MNIAECLKLVVCLCVKACRGTEFDEGTEVDDAIGEGSEPPQRIPIEADFLYAYSTTPGLCYCVIIIIIIIIIIVSGMAGGEVVYFWQLLLFSLSEVL